MSQTKIVKRIEEICQEFDSRLEAGVGVPIARLELAKALAEAESTQAWIPVTERLPEERGYYLTAGAYLNNVKWVDRLYFDDDQEWYSGQSLRRSTTHWQLLPPPPEQ